MRWLHKVKCRHDGGTRNDGPNARYVCQLCGKILTMAAATSVEPRNSAFEKAAVLFWEGSRVVGMMMIVYWVFRIILGSFLWILDVL